MTVLRAMEILTPYSGRYSPAEYEEALAMARAALDRNIETGTWVPIQRGEHGYSAGDFRCSLCSKPNPSYKLTAFCAECGKPMRKGGETP